MTNPIDYIEKCTLEDLLEFKNISKKSTRWEQLVYIAFAYLGYANWKIAKVFGKSEATIKSQKFRVTENLRSYSDDIDNLLREIGYWKYKQINSFTGREIIQFSIEGKEIDRFENVNQASIKINIPKTGIHECLINKRKSTHGYIFKFVKDNYKQLNNLNGSKI